MSDVRRGLGKFCSRACQASRERRSPEEAFWLRVNKTETCWMWTGAKIPRGYGNFLCQRKRVYAHRYSYEIHIGPITEGLFVLHRCDQPACVNPEHLFLGTHLDNMRDMRIKGRAPSTKLSAEDVLQIRELSKTLTPAEIAMRFTVSDTAIRKILTRRSWDHI